MKCILVACLAAGLFSHAPKPKPFPLIPDQRHGAWQGPSSPHFFNGHANLRYTVQRT